MTYDRYIKKYYSMHQIISKYYGKASNTAFEQFYTFFKDELDNNQYFLDEKNRIAYPSGLKDQIKEEFKSFKEKKKE